MIVISKLSRIRHRRARGRDAPKEARRYALAGDELLEYPGYSGHRSLCHLLIYVADEKPTLCIVGNFDEPVGAATSNVIEAVATAVADRIRGDDFRLMQWYPRSLGGHRYSQVLLDSVPADTVAHGETLVADDQEWWSAARQKTVVRFANPRFSDVSEDQAVELLGRQAVCELYAMAGMKGDYTPARLFGSTGRRIAEQIRAHNTAQTNTWLALVREWQAGD